MKKALKILITLVLVLVSMITIIFYAAMHFNITKTTIQHLTKDVKVVEGLKEPLDNNTSEIYCQHITGDSEYGDWVVVGKDGVLFESDNKKWEEIIIVGNVPKKMNYNVFENIFIFKGKYLGAKKEKVDKYLDGYNYSYKTFESENWAIKYPIKRILSEKDYPKDGLCLEDILDAEEIPVREVVEDDN